jgi:hypothetical protein
MWHYKKRIHKWAAVSVILLLVIVAVAVVSWQSTNIPFTARVFDEAPITARPNDPALDREIATLIHQLADNSYRIRQKATQRLGDIGLPALEALERAAARADDLEARQRAALLVKNIRQAAGSGTRFDGLEFTITAPEKWQQPKQGEKTPLAIRLDIKNTTDVPRRVYLYESIRLELADATGTPLEGGWAGYDHEGGGPMAFPILHKNESSSYVWTGGLLTSEEGITLWFTDPFNHGWQWHKLSPGRYHVTVLYWNEQQQPHRRQVVGTFHYFKWFGEMPGDNELLWVGKAWAAMDVEIVP